jgi:hypothetical protein
MLSPNRRPAGAAGLPSVTVTARGLDSDWALVGSRARSGRAKDVLFIIPIPARRTRASDSESEFTVCRSVTPGPRAETRTF